MTTDRTMPPTPTVLLSYPVVMGLLVALTLALVLLGRGPWGLGLATLYLLAVPLALAIGYLAWYRTLPYVPPAPRPAAGPAEKDEEPFEDPVEEADRWDDTKEPGDASEPEETPEPEAPADEPEVVPPEDRSTD